jgi:hypothetical protein
MPSEGLFSMKKKLSGEEAVKYATKKVMKEAKESKKHERQEKKKK